MAVELKKIIEKLKTEGVEAADKQAAEILSEAEDKAQKTIDSAKHEAEEIKQKAEKESKRLKANAEEAIKQAARDVLLGLKQDIVSLFDRVVKREVNGKLSPDTLKTMLVKLVENFKETSEAEIEILLNEDAKGEVEKLFLADLKKELKKGVTFKASPSVESGFRIGEKGAESYYDFTDEAIAEAFKNFLNPKMARLLDEASQK